MIETVEVICGVHIRSHDCEAEFLRGSLTELARGVRDALWSDLNLFADTDTLLVYVGGERPDRALEVESWLPGVPYETIRIMDSVRQRLEAVHSANMPTSAYVRWDRILLYVFKPNFHELAVSQG